MNNLAVRKKTNKFPLTFIATTRARSSLYVRFTSLTCSDHLTRQALCSTGVGLRPIANDQPTNMVIMVTMVINIIDVDENDFAIFFHSLSLSLSVSQNNMLSLFFYFACERKQNKKKKKILKFTNTQCLRYE